MPIHLEYEIPGDGTLVIDSDEEWSIEAVQRLAADMDATLKAKAALGQTVDGMIEAKLKSLQAARCAASP